jgi:membrane-bound lytic murein transglycosylase D
MRCTFLLAIFIQFASSQSLASLPSTVNSTEDSDAKRLELLRERLHAKVKVSRNRSSPSLIFDLPVTYNRKVSGWTNYFQTRGRKWFKEWLDRSHRYMPLIQDELKKAGLPQDLAYMVMIESGFSATATSHADAVGPWQFIQATSERYGLKTNWWLDERRDLKKATRAAIRYIRDLHEEFGSWYLVAASYNMGESGLRRQVKKHRTRDFWKLAQKGALPQETTDYVPKILAAMLISKAPSLYGFRDVTKLDPIEYELVQVPGGADLDELADHLGLTRKSLKDLNSELLLGYVPKSINLHTIRVPKGSSSMVTEYLSRLQGRVSKI